LPIFRGVFLKNQYYGPIFAYIQLRFEQKDYFFAKFFGENIFKIITLVPDGANFRPLVYFEQVLKNI
jgi:hypothetical protein